MLTPTLDDRVDLRRDLKPDAPCSGLDPMHLEIREAADLIERLQSDLANVRFAAQKKSLGAKDLETENARPRADADIPAGAARSSDGALYFDVKAHYRRAEDAEGLEMWLNDQGAPKDDGQGNSHSPVGRVTQLLAARPTRPSADTA